MLTLLGDTYLNVNKVRKKTFDLSHIVFYISSITKNIFNPFFSLCFPLSFQKHEAEVTREKLELHERFVFSIVKERCVDFYFSVSLKDDTA